MHRVGEARRRRRRPGGPGRGTARRTLDVGGRVDGRTVTTQRRDTNSCDSSKASAARVPARPVAPIGDDDDAAARSVRSWAADAALERVLDGEAGQPERRPRGRRAPACEGSITSTHRRTSGWAASSPTRSSGSGASPWRRWSIVVTEMRHARGFPAAGREPLYAGSAGRRRRRGLSRPWGILARRRDVAQSGSAPALGAGGRRFKSARPDHRLSGTRAGVAQLARASAFQAEGRGFEARLPLHSSDPERPRRSAAPPSAPPGVCRHRARSLLRAPSRSHRAPVAQVDRAGDF